MAKKTEKKRTAEKAERNTAPEMERGASPFASLTSGELLARFRANKKERKRLAEEDKELIGLYKATKSQEKSNSAEAKIQALTAQLEALKNSKSK